MGMYKYLQKNWNSDEVKELMKSRMISWRKQNTIVKVDKPTRLDRAHSLGYKAKQGFVIARVKVWKGAGKRERKVRGGKPSKAGQYSMPSVISKRRLAELRAGKKHPNMQVLNSYYVCEDGRQIWFEVILVDPHHGGVKNHRPYKFLTTGRGRVFRGKTSAAKKSRHLGKGKGFTHTRK
jgi:large subunit ribosomal protein L15e